jgi:6-phosphogluconolactonase/glucosamine-6-phosphate isomerase/deaminase
MSLAVMVFKDSADLAEHAADRMIQVTQDAIRVRGRAMLALAGGSTPTNTYRLLAQPDRRRRIDWAHTYLFFGDERLVRLDDPSSNFAMVQDKVLTPRAIQAVRDTNMTTGIAALGPSSAAESRDNRRLNPSPSNRDTSTASRVRLQA